MKSARPPTSAMPRGSATDSGRSGSQDTDVAEIDQVIHDVVDSRRRDTVKLVSVALIPIVAACVFAAMSLRSARSTFVDASELKQSMQVNFEAFQLVRALQRERGISALMVVINGTFPLVRDTYARRINDTNSAIDAIRRWPPGVAVVDDNADADAVARSLPSKQALLEMLEPRRQQVSGSVAETITMDDNIAFYTSINVAIIRSLSVDSSLRIDNSLWQLLNANDLLLQLTDSVGVQRAIGAAFYFACHLSLSHLRAFVEITAQSASLVSLLLDHSAFGGRLELQQVAASAVTLYKEQLLSDAASRWCRNDSVERRFNRSLEWFDNMTICIDVAANVRRDVVSRVVDKLSAIEQSARQDFSVYICVLLLVVVLCSGTCGIYLTGVHRLTTRIYVNSKHLRIVTLNLKREKLRTDTLLYQMLPRSVADQLKRNETVTAEQFDSVTVSFSNIVQFTTIASQCEPMQIVQFLNTIYGTFDGTAEEYNVYKVETIGDAYMIVSGLPVRNGDNHCVEVACFWLDLLKVVSQFILPNDASRTLQIRVGINTGSCVAGVVGLKIPRYCLFGDTVNTASRMELHGLPMKIHISDATRAALERSGRFVMEPRGLIEVKGKGAMSTYWLNGRTEASSNPTKQVQLVT